MERQANRSRCALDGALVYGFGWRRSELASETTKEIRSESCQPGSNNGDPRAGRKPPDAVIVSRPSKWGNPFHIDQAHDRATVVQIFRDWIKGDDSAAIKMRSEIKELRGKDLLCWCLVPGPCHGDVLLEMANR
jgi:hypothetical protein